MSRNLDTSLAAALANGNIQPVILVAIKFKSGMAYAWNGVGDLVWNGNTFKGVGSFASIGSISEASDVRAEGTRIGLSGIGGIPAASGTPPPGMTSPFTPGSGQYVAWALPTKVTTSGGGVYNSVDAGLDFATLTGTQVGGLGVDQGVSAVWSDFELPPLPADASILNTSMCALLSGYGSVPNMGFGDTFGASIPSSGTFSGQYDVSKGAMTEAQIASATMGLNVGGSVQLGGSGLMVLTMSGIGIIVLYSSAEQSISMLSEALADVQTGAPAQIWVGLMSNGAFIGSPYLTFSGLVDQPQIRAGASTIDIMLALESRLSDLARPSGRRYTAADQKLFYPDDSGFDWVETLNDRANRWGG